MSFTTNQLRQACALLRWSSPVLAECTGVTYGSIAPAWSADSVDMLSGGDMQALRSKLEAAGVEFIPENGGGAGVRLRKGEAI